MAKENDFIRNIDKHVGRRIHDYRIAAGLSRENMATNIGVTHQQLAKYEHGVNRISIGRLLLICKELNKPVTSFIEEYDINTHNSMLAKERLTIELVRSFHTIKNDKIRGAINTLVKAIGK